MANKEKRAKIQQEKKEKRLNDMKSNPHGLSKYALKKWNKSNGK